VNAIRYYQQGIITAEECNEKLREHGSKERVPVAYENGQDIATGIRRKNTAYVTYGSISCDFIYSYEMYDDRGIIITSGAHLKTRDQLKAMGTAFDRAAGQAILDPGCAILVLM
jgi:hypothetical protein